MYVCIICSDKFQYNDRELQNPGLGVLRSTTKPNNARNYSKCLIAQTL